MKKYIAMFAIALILVGAGYYVQGNKRAGLQNTDREKTGVVQDELKPGNFKGEKGERVVLENEKIQINVLLLDDGIAKFFNVQMPSGKTIYFFAVKDQFGTYRAAANGCQVCFGERKGFHQEGNQMVCDNCGNRYPLNKIASEKGGCNPGPINPNLKVVNGKITITQTELEQISDLF